MDKKILVTTLVCTDDFLKYGELLEQTFEKRYKSKYPFEMLVTDNVNLNSFQFEEDTHYKIIPYKEFDNKQRFQGTINKFYVYTLEEYDYVVFLDADIYLIDNIDEIIDLMIECNEGNRYITDVPMEEYNKRYVTSHFFAAKPSKEFYQKVLRDDLNKGEDGVVFTDYFKEDVANEICCWPLGCYIHDTGPEKLLDGIPKLEKELLHMSDNDYLYYMLKVRSITIHENGRSNYDLYAKLYSLYKSDVRNVSSLHQL